MPTFVLFALISLGAQLVDGSLGMGYGVTTTTLLLAAGASPVAASATVHFAEIGTTLASGLSHWRFGNVDWQVVAKIGAPGAVGAFAGAALLTSFPTAVARPVMSLVLVGLGGYLLARFTLRGWRRGNLGKPVPALFLGPLGLVAGFVNALGGGGWGPIGTPAILSSGRMEPRTVIGSVDTSKFLVSASGSLGFLLALGSSGVDGTRIAGLLIGGVVAAPFAAWLVRRIAARMLGSLVGGMLVVTNVHTLLGEDGVAVAVPVRTAATAVVVAVWIAAVGHSWRQHRRDRALRSADALAEEPTIALERSTGAPLSAGRPSGPRQ